MGLPNWLTILRILLIPVFVTLLVYRRAGLALLVFCLASLTDLLDGYIARSQGRQTRLGAFLDPMADKLLLTSGFVTLTWLKVIPFWITAVVVSRDVVLSIGVLVIHVAGGTVHPAPTWIGKMSTVFQMLTVLAAMASVYFQLVPGVRHDAPGLGDGRVHDHLGPAVPHPGTQAARDTHLRGRARLTMARRPAADRRGRGGGRGDGADPGGPGRPAPRRPDPHHQRRRRCAT